MTSCSIYLTMDTAMNGDGTWGGFTSLRDKIGNITNLLSSAVTQIQIYFPGDEWLVDSLQAMQTANIDIYRNYNTSQMITPNPDSTATAANAGQSVPLIDSLFIKTGMGPNGTANTMATDIDGGLQTTAKVHHRLSIASTAGLCHHQISRLDRGIIGVYSQQFLGQSEYPVDVQPSAGSGGDLISDLRREVLHGWVRTGSGRLPGSLRSGPRRQSSGLAGSGSHAPVRPAELP